MSVTSHSVNMETYVRENGVEDKSLPMFSHGAIRDKCVRKHGVHNKSLPMFSHGAITDKCVRPTVQHEQRRNANFTPCFGCASWAVFQDLLLPRGSSINMCQRRKGETKKLEKGDGGGSP